MAEHGTRQCYANGCRLPECKTAQAKYQREYKARKAGVEIQIARQGRPRKGATVTALPVAAARPQTPRAVGPTEQATLDELATLTSAETRKAMAAGVLVMARILDNPEALSQQPQAFAKLTAAMADLRQGSTRRKGRLASVQAMTKQATGT